MMATVNRNAKRNWIMRARAITAGMLLLAAAILFGVNGRRQATLAAQRAAGGLGTAVALEGSSPAIAFTTIALGGFRGLLADLLWLRAARLQDEARFFELVQLAEWITRLEPRSAGVWSYHAWNMAYNVSAMMATPDERWQWIHNGIQLLRDEGLRYNPDQARLYFELGWLYQHKIGAAPDPFLPDYQLRLARNVERVLPNGHLPATPPSDPTALADSLRRELGLELDTMRAIESEIGPLDWSVPEAHSLYWAYHGLARSNEPRNMLCSRMLCQSAESLFFSGRITVDPSTGSRHRSLEPELLDGVLRTYSRIIEAGGWTNAAESRRAFIDYAITLLDAAGRPDAANNLRLLTP
jgi:hypothetical protein